jgi:hypothetical protein
MFKFFNIEEKEKMENGKELITYAPEFPSSKDSMAVSFVKMVKINLAEVQKSFFEIGSNICRQ